MQWKWDRKVILAAGIGAAVFIVVGAGLLYYFEPATVKIQYDRAGKCSGGGSNVRVTITNYHFRPLASTIVIIKAYKEGFSKNLVTNFDTPPKGVAFRHRKIIPPFSWSTRCRSLIGLNVDGNPKTLKWTGILYQTKYGYPY